MARGNRFRIYDAERNLDRLYFSSTEAAQGWLNWVCRTKWWKQHTTIKHVDLLYPTFSMSGSEKVDDSLGRIEVYATSLEVLTLCHELAHLIDWRPRTNSQERCHDAQFAGVCLSVVKRYMGAKWALKLAEYYEAEGVKIIPYE